MDVGVLGGGFQGCCAALALAERSVNVTLIDRNDALLSRAAVANEGKVHLGYMYAGDPSLATAKTMITGALAFAPFLERQLCQSAQLMATSVPATYVVHRDSQRSCSEISAYLETVHGLVGEAAEGRSKAYFGKDLRSVLRPWSAAQIDEAFDPAIATAAFDTPEVAINPRKLAHAIREIIAAHPRIEVRCNRIIVGANEEREGIRVWSNGQEGCAWDRFDHVVNALWDGRLEIDKCMGFRNNRPWLHRLKYGVSFRLPDGVRSPPSATFVLGPFGEVVSYDDRLIYLTWYPEGLQAISTDLRPPEWSTYPPEPLRSRVLTGTIRALSDVVPLLRGLQVDRLSEARVMGGVIVAWGKTDIHDPESELHRRYEIGVTSTGRYHSIDPGKLTMAPYFAERCAEQIVGSARTA